MLHNALTQATNFASLGLGLTGAGAWLRPRRDIRAVFYHGLGDRNSPCMRYLDDELPEAVFARQIDYLMAHYRVVSLSDAVASIDDDASAKPVCCISFDDGLASVYHRAFRILKAHGLPFCVFVNTASVDNRALLWLHSLSYLIDKYGLEAVNRHIARCCREAGAALTPTATGTRELFLWCHDHFDFLYRHGIVAVVLASFNEDMGTVAGQQNLYLTWSQLREMQANGAEVFSHTHSHCPLDRLVDTETIDDEIGRAGSVLAEAGFADAAFVSFPFGMVSDYGRRAVRSAFGAGHHYVVEVGDGLNDPDRVRGTNMIARVELGSTGTEAHALHAAIELKPLVKTRLKHWMKKSDPKE